MICIVHKKEAASNAARFNQRSARVFAGIALSFRNLEYFPLAVTDRFGSAPGIDQRIREPDETVIVSATLGHAGHHRLNQLRPVERLHSALFVHAQPHRMRGRIMLQANAIDDIVNKLWILGDLSSAGNLKSLRWSDLNTHRRRTQTYRNLHPIESDIRHERVAVGVGLG